MMAGSVSGSAPWLLPTPTLPAAPNTPGLSADALLQASRILARLDVPASCLSHAQTAAALALASQKPQRLELVTKWLYPDVAAFFNSSPACIERNIRSVRTLVWQNSRGILFEMIGHPLARRPGNARFLGYLVSSLMAEDRCPKNHNPEDAEPL